MRGLQLRRRTGGIALGACMVAALAGCELAEVTTAEGKDLLVVEAVLRAESRGQAVLLHRTIKDRSVEGVPRARVTITGPDGAEVQLFERPRTACTDGIPSGMVDSLAVRPTCYVDLGRLYVRPGATYELKIESPEGERVRGRTTVPGPFEVIAPAANGCLLGADTNFGLIWSRARSAWSYLAILELTGLRRALAGTELDAPDRLELTGVAISESDTTLTLPADFGIFDLGEVDQRLLQRLQGGLPRGSTARVVIGAADRNYVNAIRGGSFNPSGNVRLSSVVGDGVGVFGSVLTREIMVYTDPELSALPPCGGGRAGGGRG